MSSRHSNEILDQILLGVTRSKHQIFEACIRGRTVSNGQSTHLDLLHLIQEILYDNKLRDILKL